VQTVLMSELQGFAVATCKQLLLSVFPAAPDRTDGMNDIAGLELIPLGNFGIAGSTSAKSPAFSKKLRTGCPVDSPVHAATAEQAPVRGIDDDIHCKSRYIRQNCFHLFPLWPE
jgi:hypothetical protein